MIWFKQVEYPFGSSKLKTPVKCVSNQLLRGEISSVFLIIE